MLIQPTYQGLPNAIDDADVLAALGLSEQTISRCEVSRTRWHAGWLPHARAIEACRHNPGSRVCRRCGLRLQRKPFAHPARPAIQIPNTGPAGELVLLAVGDDSDPLIMAGSAPT